MIYAPPCDRPPSPATLRKGSAFWLLSIEIAGRVLRYSSKAVSVPDGANIITYRGGVSEVTASGSLDILQQNPSAPSVNFGLIVEEDLALLVSYGHRLDRSIAELSWYVEGTDFSERQIIIRGPILVGAYGEKGEPLTGVIEAQPQGDGALVANRTIYSRSSVPRIFTGTDVLDYLVPDSLGEPYPIVFGIPFELRREADEGSIVVTRPSSTKALRWRALDSDPEVTLEILICEGHVTNCGSLRVTWRDTPSGTDNGTATVTGANLTLTFDGNGVPVTTLNLVTALSLSVAQRRAVNWYVTWEDAVGPLSLTPGSVQTFTRTFTAADHPFNETILQLESGDTIQRAAWQTISGWGSASTANITLETPALTLRALNTAQLNTIGTYESAVSPTVRGTTRINFDLTAPLATGSAEGRVRLDIRRSPPLGSRLTSLGELAYFLAERSGQKTDLAAWAAIVPLLNVPVGGLLPAERHAWDFLLSDVLAIAPVSIRIGPQGFVPVLWRWWATQADVVEKFRVGYDGVVCLPDIRSARPDSEIATSAEMRYAYDIRRDNFSLTLTMDGGENLPIPFRDQFNAHKTATLDSSVSSQLYGAGRVLRLDSRIVYATATAAWICRWRLAAEGWAHRIIELEVPQHRGHLTFGDIVAVTHPSIYLDDALGFILSISLTDVGRVTYKIALLDGSTSIRVNAVGTAGTPWRPGGPINEPNPN